MPNSIEDLEQDLPYQRREWVIQRIGWSLMAALLAAAVVGLFGRGPLSQAEASLPDGSLKLEYDRILRFQAPAELRTRLQPRATADEAVLALSREYVQGISISEIQPPPKLVRSQGENVVYHFPVQDAAQELEIVLRLKTETLGPLTGEISAGGGPLKFTQFVLP